MKFAQTSLIAGASPEIFSLGLIIGTHSLDNLKTNAEVLILKYHLQPLQMARFYVDLRKPFAQNTLNLIF